VTSVQIGDGVAVLGSPALDQLEPAVYFGTEGGAIYRVMPPIP